jgi:TatD DNase family protein
MTHAHVLPALDCHAHIAPDVTSHQLSSLGEAHVFAMTRSLAEATAVARRHDPGITWGIGIHPGVDAARSAYDPDRLRVLLPSFALVGEVGLDRRAGREDQTYIFTDILNACRDRPVLISVHSAGRTAEVVDLIDHYRHPGVILHWFLGTDDQRERVLAAGTYLSVNESMSDAILQAIPMDRLLPETDFPARQVRARLPGEVAPLEQRLSRLWDLSKVEVRHQLWVNLKAIAIASGALDVVSDELADRLLAV